MLPGDLTKVFERAVSNFSQYGNMLKAPALAGPQLAPCASSARAWRLWAAWYSSGERPRHWTPSHRLRCSSEPPPKSPISVRLTVQVLHLEDEPYARCIGSAESDAHNVESG